MKRICSWCVPNHVMGVTCDFCGSVDCVQATDEEYWLCVDCGKTFTDNVITSGICPEASLILRGNEEVPQGQEYGLSTGQSWCLILAINALVWFAIGKAVLWAIR